MDPLTIILLLVLIGTIGFGIYTFQQSKSSEAESTVSTEKADSSAKEKILDAEKKAQEIEKEARKQANEIRNKLSVLEKTINSREQKLIQKGKELDKKFEEAEREEKSLMDKRRSLKNAEQQLTKKLEEISQLTKDEARAELRKEIEKELESWSAKKIREIEEDTVKKSKEASNKILVEAMLNSAVDFVADTTTTTIEIPDDSLKSRIIGKSGRNVKTFERLTGVDVIIDESPNEITISCFDPIRREVAAITMNRLVKTGKINPAAIEEMIQKVKKDLLKEIKKTGEDIAFEAGFNDLPNEIIMLLGRFKYRFSAGQNLVKHTLETIKLAEQLALDLGANVRKVKLAALLHDVGKVSPMDGKQFFQISADIATRYFDDEVVVNAVESQTDEVKSKFIESEILKIANSISETRPGAAKTDYESYVRRMRELEDIAKKMDGVKNVFAISAGKEVRVIVEPNKVSDDGTRTLAFDIAREIEDSQAASGLVKVNVIREYRGKAEAH